MRLKTTTLRQLLRILDYPVVGSPGDLSSRERRSGKRCESIDAKHANAALLVTDVEGFTAMVEQIGDEAALSIMDRHDRILLAAISNTGGLKLAHTGDGMIVAFPSVPSALTYVAQVRREIAELSKSSGHLLRFRSGLHVGSLLVTNERGFGSAVNYVVRVCSHARTGTIWASQEAVRCLGTEERASALRCLPVSLRGFAGEHVLYELAGPGVRGGEPIIADPDTDEGAPTVTMAK